jgi:hypothetical protein
VPGGGAGGAGGAGATVRPGNRPQTMRVGQSEADRKRESQFRKLAAREMKVAAKLKRKHVKASEKLQAAVDEENSKLRKSFDAAIKQSLKIKASEEVKVVGELKQVITNAKQKQEETMKALLRAQATEFKNQLRAGKDQWKKQGVLQSHLLLYELQVRTKLHQQFLQVQHQKALENLKVLHTLERENHQKRFSILQRTTQRQHQQQLEMVQKFNALALKHRQESHALMMAQLTERQMSEMAEKQRQAEFAPGAEDVRQVYQQLHKQQREALAAEPLKTEASVPEVVPGPHAAPREDRRRGRAQEHAALPTGGRRDLRVSAARRDAARQSPPWRATVASRPESARGAGRGREGDAADAGQSARAQQARQEREQVRVELEQQAMQLQRRLSDELQFFYQNQENAIKAFIGSKQQYFMQARAAATQQAPQSASAASASAASASAAPQAQAPQPAQRPGLPFQPASRGPQRGPMTDPNRRKSVLVKSSSPLNGNGGAPLAYRAPPRWRATACRKASEADGATTGLDDGRNNSSNRQHRRHLLAVLLVAGLLRRRRLRVLRRRLLPTLRRTTFLASFNSVLDLGDVDDDDDNIDSLSTLSDDLPVVDISAYTDHSEADVPDYANESPQSSGVFDNSAWSDPPPTTLQNSNRAPIWRSVCRARRRRRHSRRRRRQPPPQQQQAPQQQQQQQPVSAGIVLAPQQTMANNDFSGAGGSANVSANLSNAGGFANVPSLHRGRTPTALHASPSEEQYTSLRRFTVSAPQPDTSNYSSAAFTNAPQVAPRRATQAAAPQQASSWQQPQQQQQQQQQQPPQQQQQATATTAAVSTVCVVESISTSAVSNVASTTTAMANATTATTVATCSSSSMQQQQQM